MPKQIIFIRHGETPYNAAHKFMNWETDAGLTKQGIEQANIVGKRLKNYHIDAVYVSDLRRAAETAAIVEQHIGLTPLHEKLLRERNLGKFGGLTVSEIKEQYADEFKQWINHYDLDWNGLEGESLKDVHTRFHALLAMLEAKHAEETVLLVTHGGFLAITLRDIFNFFPKESHFDVEHTSITILEKHDGKYLLHSYNDVGTE